MIDKLDKAFYVYIYYDDNGVPVYVGKGSSTRIDKHITYVKKRLSRNKRMRTHFYNFLAKMIKQGKEPKRLISQDKLVEKEAHELEIYLIKLFGRRDLKTGTLLNHTEGGEGSVGLKWSKESREGEKNGFYGKKHTENWKKQHSETIGDILKQSEKFKEYHKTAKLTGKRKGEKRTEETRRRISEARKELFRKRLLEGEKSLFKVMSDKIKTIREALKTSIEAVNSLEPEVISEFNEGREAFTNGVSQKDNPYHGTEAFQLWQTGFRYQRDNHSDGD